MSAKVKVNCVSEVEVTALCTKTMTVAFSSYRSYILVVVHKPSLL